MIDNNKILPNKNTLKEIAGIAFLKKYPFYSKTVEFSEAIV